MSSYFKSILLCLILFSGIQSKSEIRSDAKTFKSNLSTPRRAVENHLYYLQDEHFNPEKASKSLYFKGYTQKQLNERAIQLKQIFDGRAIYIQPKRIPDNPEYKDSLHNAHFYIIDKKHPRIHLEKYGEKWLYSQETVESIPELHRDVYPFGTDKLLNLLSGLGHDEFMGLYVWQHIGILILIVLSFILHKLLTYFIDRILLKFLRRVGYTKLVYKLVLPIARPLSLFIIFGLLSLLVPVLQLPIEIAEYVILGLRASLPLLGTIVLYKLVDIVSMYLEDLAGKTESTLDDQLVPLLRKAFKAFIILIGSIFVLQNLRFDVTALIAGLSIGGLAFALAAQDTLKNFFGSVMIFVDRPFQIGDWIVTNDIDGDVEEVGFRSTRVRTFHNSLIYVPNGRLADMTIDNMGMRKYRRYKTYLSITYDTPSKLVELFIKGIEKIVLEHPNTRKDYYNIYMTDFSDSSLNVLLYIFFAVPTWPEELRSRHEINLKIMNLAEHLNVRFAFPTQTVHIEDFPEKQSKIPVYEVENSSSYDKKLDEFFNKDK